QRDRDADGIGEARGRRQANAVSRRNAASRSRRCLQGGQFVFRALSTETLATGSSSRFSSRLTRAKVLAMSVFAAGTYRKPGERIEECPLGSRGLFMAKYLNPV